LARKPQFPALHRLYRSFQFHRILNLDFHALWNPKLQGSVLYNLGYILYLTVMFLIRHLLSVFLYQKQSAVVISCKMPAGEIKTVKDYRDSLAESIFHCALNQRLFKLSRRRDPPYFSCSSAADALVRPVKAYIMTSSCREKGTVEALESMLVEVLNGDRFLAMAPCINKNLMVNQLVRITKYHGKFQ
jgi:hypothetical protein